MRLNWLLAALAAATVSLSVTAASAEDVGQATRVQRFAYQTAPQANRAPLYRMGAIVKNAKLETVPAGALEVTFTDGSRLTLGSASAIVVDNYVFAGSQGSGQQTLRMTKGLFRFVSGSMPKDQVRLQTPSVSIGIRGTTVKAKVNDDGSGVIFFEHGHGVIDNGKGQQVPIAEGEMVDVGPDGAIGKPVKKSWTAGDVPVDQGLNPFGQSFGGTDGGTGGGDGAGSSGGNNRGND
jgi:hypothetical protein